MQKAVALFVVVLSSWAASANDELPPGTIRHDASRLAWKPAPPPLPAGMETVVLEGDPR